MQLLQSILESLHDEISLQISGGVTFHNGCWLSLVHEDGVYAGTDPYGTDKLFEASRALETIPSWIAYWNEPRDEWGTLMEH